MERDIADFLLEHKNPYGLGSILPPSAKAVVKDVDTKQGIVQMYWSAFGIVDSYRDVVTSGAFAKTIREWGPSGRQRIAHLMNHDPTHRVAVPKELMEDKIGLLATTKFFSPDHSKARDALIEYEEGAITEHSIGFRIVKWEYDPDEDLLLLTEIQLYEGSGVTWGANMETPTIDVKALQQDPLLFENLISQVKALQRCLSREITDQRAKELEVKLDGLQSVVTGLDAALRKEFNLKEPAGLFVPNATLSGSKQEPPVDPELATAQAMLDIVKNLNIN